MIEHFLVPNSHVFLMNVPKEVHISHSSVIYLKSWFQNFCSELNVRITKCYMHQTFYDGENHVSNDLKMKRQIRHFPIIVEIKKILSGGRQVKQVFINPTDRSRNSKKFGLEYKSEGKKHFIEKSTQIWCAIQHCGLLLTGFIAGELHSISHICCVVLRWLLSATNLLSIHLLQKAFWNFSLKKSS